MKKIYSILFFLLFIDSPISFAGGSAYSRYGFGDILRYGDSRLYAMSGTGIAFIDETLINGFNPAGLARISRTRFSGGFEYNRFETNDGINSSTYSTGGFQGLAFAFPISKENGIVLSMNATPFSSVRYAIDYSSVDTYSGLMLNQKYYGSGGITDIGLGLSCSILNTLHIGGHFGYLFGRTRLFQTSSFESSYYLSTYVDETTYYSGFGLTLGIIYEDIGTLLKTKFLQNLTIGITFSTGSKLDVERQTIYSAVDSIFSDFGKAEIPFSVGLGVSYPLSDDQKILGDIYFENWKDAKQFNPEIGTLRNSLRASIGYELTPSKNADSYLKRITYRAGFAYNSTYYNIKVNDNGIHKFVGINEFLFSGGLGLPFGPEAQLNLGIQVGLRGSTDYNLMKDTIIKFSAAISASEIWFLKFEEE